MYLGFITLIEIDSETCNIYLFFEIEIIQPVLTRNRIRNHAIGIGSRSSMVPFKTRPICIPTFYFSSWIFKCICLQERPCKFEWMLQSKKFKFGKKKKSVQCYVYLVWRRIYDNWRYVLTSKSHYLKCRMRCSWFLCSVGENHNECAENFFIATKEINWYAVFIVRIMFTYRKTAYS